LGWRHESIIQKKIASGIGVLLGGWSLRVTGIIQKKIARILNWISEASAGDISLHNLKENSKALMNIVAFDPVYDPFRSDEHNSKENSKSYLSAARRAAVWATTLAHNSKENSKLGLLGRILEKLEELSIIQKKIASLEQLPSSG